ncbi:MAG: MotA/TolQ/ExbB proton channel family protein [Planctomycetes bacterium]|nr:MotA/TolQ/ExbB proton channel family protein [Planctomycetota bacterium]
MLRGIILACCLAAVLAGPGVIRVGRAQDAAGKTSAAASESGQTTEAAAKQSFWEMIFGSITSSLIILVLILLSLVAAALIFEHVMTLREGVLMPPQLAPAVRESLVQGDVAGAEQHCKAQPCFLAFVLQAGIAEIDGGWASVEKAMEDAVGEQSARLFRKIEYLSVIGNIAPMVGLLGTVTGMMFAFAGVANEPGEARTLILAQGIYTALFTTFLGLLVAIPCLAAFAIFRNRVDQLVAEAAYQAQHVFTPLKRRRTKTKATGQQPSGAGPIPPPPPN